MKLSLSSVIALKQLYKLGSDNFDYLGTGNQAFFVVASTPKDISRKERWIQTSYEVVQYDDKVTD